MTLTLLAVSLNEQPLSQPITACFDANGGTIGRADHNTMALPDPERHISRLQAEIIATGPRYLIKNVGAANPIVVGARSLSQGESAPLTDRDQVRIGGYLLQVVVDADNDPRGADITRGRAAVAAGQAPQPAPFPSSYHPEPRAELRSDPRQQPNPLVTTSPPRPAPAVGGLADFGTPLSSNNPFADLMGSPAPAPGFGLPHAPGGGSSGNTFADLLPGPAGVRSGSSALGAAAPDPGTRPFSPADLDVFAAPRPAPAALPPAAADDPFAGLIPASSPPSSLDDVFGLRGASSGAGADPLAMFESGLGGGGAGAPTGAAATPGGLSTDPLALFGAGTPPAPPAAPVAANHTPDILAGFTPPKPILPPASPALTAPPAPPPFVPPPVVPTTMRPAPAVANPRAAGTFDWANPVPPTRGPLPEPTAQVLPPASPPPDLDLDFGAPARKPTPGAVYGAPPTPAAPPPLPLPPQAPAGVPTAFGPAPVTPVAPHAAARQPTAAGPGGDALWAAFCQGAGIDPTIAAGADEALMRDIGALLRAAVGGTLQLMSVRATTKGELGAAVTIIQQRGNNPLKFSPDATTGLEQLLRPPMRGFLAGPAAMTDAMHDLVGHAIGTVAGMRAALDGMLERFAPGQLESKMVGGSLLDSVLPMNRKAKLWELYLQHFESIREEAQEDFHNLFGKAFLAAYEQQVERLKQGGGPG